MPPLSAAFIASHQALLALVPQGLHTILPTLPVGAPIGPRSVDYTTFIEWLGLPRFAPEEAATNWINFFAKELPEDDRRPAVCRLLELIEFGARPSDRKQDLRIARRKLPIRPGSTRPPTVVMRDWDEEQIQRVADFPSVAKALNEFRVGAKRMRPGEWNDESILKLLGYSVGKAGPPATKRHAALEACFVLHSTAIPRVQRESWGTQGTRHRVRRIRSMIEFFLMLAERKSHRDLREACRDWRDDLRWISEQWPGA